MSEESLIDLTKKRKFWIDKESATDPECIRVIINIEVSGYKFIQGDLSDDNYKDLKKEFMDKIKGGEGDPITAWIPAFKELAPIDTLYGEDYNEDDYYFLRTLSTNESNYTDLEAGDLEGVYEVAMGGKWSGSLKDIMEELRMHKVTVLNGKDYLVQEDVSNLPPMGTWKVEEWKAFCDDNIPSGLADDKPIICDSVLWTRDFEGLTVKVLTVIGWISYITQ